MQRKTVNTNVTSCSRIITFPQYTGTCWYNALLMATLYSEGMHSICVQASKTWPGLTKQTPGLDRILHLIETILTQYHQYKNTKEKLLKYEYFKTVTPEYILHLLHKLDPVTFPFDPDVHKGFAAVYYLGQFLKLMNIRVLHLDKLNISGKVAFVLSQYTDMSLFPSMKQIMTRWLSEKAINDMLSLSYFDAIVINVSTHNNLDYPLHYLTNKANLQSQSGKFVKDKMPDHFAFNNQTYVIDSCLLSSLDAEICTHSHEICGITCNASRFVYNGWLKHTNDPAMMIDKDVIVRSAYPCELMLFDWLDVNDDFCINVAQCKLNSAKKVPKNTLCFNFQKSNRTYIYVNKDAIKRKIPNHLDVKQKSIPNPIEVEKQPKYNHTPKSLPRPLTPDHVQPKPRSTLPKHTPIQKVDIVVANENCIRQVSNCSKMKMSYMFDNKQFNPNLLLNDLSVFSPKLEALLANLEKLDAKDIKESKHIYKHFIYSDLKLRGYGAKIIASALIAKGWNLVYDDQLAIKSTSLLKTSTGFNFALLSSTSIYGQPSTTNLKKRLLSLYNSRSTNNHGQLVNVIILDSGFKEGIDLLDVKYVHMFEPALSSGDQKQVIGRATRTCGQVGLEFNKQKGWPLDVFIYDSSLPANLKTKKNISFSTMGELALKTLGIDPRQTKFAIDLEKQMISVAVDKRLNNNIHTFLKRRMKRGGGKSNIWVTDRTRITNKYKQFAWPHAELENGCIQKAKHESFQLNPSQLFVSHFFTPQSNVNGILLNFSTGSGKTCAAIATASSSFEEQGYTVIWVTRTTLKTDLWKNMFDQICNMRLRAQMNAQGLKIPANHSARKRLLSSTWSIPPLSYRQFSNLLAGKNEYSTKLINMNGNKLDPLAKTLVIIDEAHKLYDSADLSTVEQPDTDMISKMIKNSYRISGKDSVKVMLMTATPITNKPMNFIKMLNLIVNVDKCMPEEFDTFSTAYLNKQGSFTSAGASAFKTATNGNILYLNRERDARQFAQPVIHKIHVPISTLRTPYDSTKQDDHEYKTNLELLKNAYTVDVQELAKLKTNIEKLKKQGIEIKDNLVDLKAGLTSANNKLNHKANIEQVKFNLNNNRKLIKQLNTDRIALVTKINNVEKTLKLDSLKTKIEMRTERERIKNDYSQERMLTELCGI